MHIPIWQSEKWGAPEAMKLEREKAGLYFSGWHSGRPNPGAAASSGTSSSFLERVESSSSRPWARSCICFVPDRKFRAENGGSRA